MALAPWYGTPCAIRLAVFLGACLHCDTMSAPRGMPRGPSRLASWQPGRRRQGTPYGGNATSSATRLGPRSSAPNSIPGPPADLKPKEPCFRGLATWVAETGRTGLYGASRPISGHNPDLSPPRNHVGPTGRPLRPHQDPRRPHLRFPADSCRNRPVAPGGGDLHPRGTDLFPTGLHRGENPIRAPSTRVRARPSYRLSICPLVWRPYLWTPIYGSMCFCWSSKQWEP